MKKILVIFFAALLPILVVSCTKGGVEPSSDANNDDAKVEDVYFVKYASNGLSGRYDASYTKEDGKNTSLQNIAGSDFERTVGPVKKGFKASFSISIDYSKAAVRIEVKKNDEPFLVKAESTYGSVSYTIE